MNRLALFTCISSTLALACSPKEDTPKQESPNVILILADDLGYGELGSYGQQKIETPNLDRLSESGMTFRQFYTGSPVCAPARYVLLTGKHSGHAYIRGNDEWSSRGDVWSYKAMAMDSTLEGQRPIPANTATIARVLKDAGYRTGMIGKWGLGAPHTESVPNRMGFDYFRGYNCQRQAHTYYPLHLYENDRRLPLANDTIPPRTALAPESDPYEMDSYSPFELKTYAPDVMFEGLTEFLENDDNSPFFLYWATPIPHLPLQAPESWVDYYVEKFGEESPYVGDSGYFPARYPRATYAAMISYLDENIGRMIQKLKDIGEYDNTLILFTSDNGPTYTGGAQTSWFNSGGPFSSEYGRGKGFLYEGGIRVPFIAAWPGKIYPGTESNAIGAAWDLFPTICEVAGVQNPIEIDGVSLLPIFLDASSNVTNNRPYLYWEFPEYNGQQALRMGNWKAIRKDIQDGNLQIELYNLEHDPTEQINLSSEYPDIINDVEEIFQKEHTQAELSSFRMAALGDELD